MNPVDPYNEEEWGDEVEKSDLFVIYVIGQDMNFLSKKIKRIVNKRHGWYDYDYKIATLTLINTINFNGSATENNPYPAENIEGILNGTELVGCVTTMNQVRFKTLQDLCNIMNVPLNSINIYRN